ncbi:DoxX family protein [Nonomuraea wenchangensis]
MRTESRVQHPRPRPATPLRNPPPPAASNRSWQAAAAIAIIAPGLPLIKEWAYAGAFFLWSSAVASHLIAGDRRLAGTRLRRYRPADAGQDGAGPSETRPRAWAVPLGVLVVLYAVSFLTLPAAEAMTYGWAVELGWIDESRPMSH